VYTKVSETTNTAIRSASTSNRLVDGESSGRRRSTARLCCPPAAATSIYSLAPTFIGYLSTTPTKCSCIEETLTFLCYTAEASVALTPKRPAPDQRRVEQAEPVVGRPVRASVRARVRHQTDDAAVGRTMPAMSRSEPLVVAVAEHHPALAIELVEHLLAGDVAALP